jgi:cytochrome P450
MRLFGPKGNLFRFARDTVGESHRLFVQHGPFVALVRGGGTNILTPYPGCPGTVLCYGPEMTREVTTQHEIYHKVHLSGRLHPLGQVSPRWTALKNFGGGLFGVNEDEHRRQRRLMMPAFQKQRIDSYRDDIVRITNSVLARWQPGTVFDVSRSMQDLTKRVATQCFFGEDIGSDHVGTGYMLQELITLLAQPSTRLFAFDLPGTKFHRFINLANKMQTVMREIITQKRAAGRDDGDVLSMLIQARDEEGGLSEDELIAHVGVIFAAGHETSSNALTWTLFLLSQHPEVQARVCDEVRGVLHGSDPTVEQLARMPLLEAVIKESMRVLPPVPWNGRVTSRETVLGGYEVPANTEIMLSIYETHHMAELYPQPERFDPRRWETIEPSAYEYNPFSAGPRMCIGASFAMLEIKLVLAMLLDKYRVELAPGQTVDRFGNIVMAPRRGLRILVRQDGDYRAGVGGVKGNVREMVELS